MSNSYQNKKAWEFNAYDFWCQHYGTPAVLAEKLIADPRKALRRHLSYLGNVCGKHILNPLGSNGRKAVPLALLGAQVTVIDISEENQKYAIELAQAAQVNIEYQTTDFMSSEPSNYDIAYLEGGILHYFDDLTLLFNKLYDSLNNNGLLVLDDFHPFRKVIDIEDDQIKLNGNYFESEFHEDYVAFAKLYEGIDQDQFPKCILRYYTMGEIITAVAQAGFRIELLKEYERFDNHKNIPGNFIIKAVKI